MENNISKEILIMVKKDQDLRKDPRPWKEKSIEIHEVDKVNELRMKEIVTEIGWPTITKVGKDASYGAWLLVQHHPLEFQLICLQMMEAAITANAVDINPQNIAYLKDRVLMRQGKKQIYGTQVMTAKNGKSYIFPIQDKELVDMRRIEIGLDSLTEYMKNFENIELTDDLSIFA